MGIACFEKKSTLINPKTKKKEIGQSNLCIFL